MLQIKALARHTPWIIPLTYAVIAFSAALTIPRVEERAFPNLTSPMSALSAVAIYSAIGSGMIALSGIVFSLAFVMVQFSSTAYSPRLVLWIARDRVMSNALGVFVATFLYAIGALAGVDRHRSGNVPFISVFVVIALLLASVVMFVALIHRIGLLQINRMLIFIGNQGCEVIEALYSRFRGDTRFAAPAIDGDLPTSLIVVHQGRPRAVQAIDADTLIKLSRDVNGTIEVLTAVGDTVLDSMPLLIVKGSAGRANEIALRRAVTLGTERTFEQDPKYPLRLLVDVAIKALSPAVNDPTTAVQALDQIQDLLLRLGRSHLDIGQYRDFDGKLRVMIRVPEWEDFLRLAFDEIRAYGSGSVQVMRRMRAVIRDLIEVLPTERHSALRHWESRLALTVTRSFADTEEQRDASTEDRQGLGIPRQNARKSGDNWLKESGENYAHPQTSS